MPAFLRDHGYIAPTNNRDGPFQRRTDNVGSTMFECLQKPENRAQAHDFNLLMKFTTTGRRSFLEVCDVKRLLQNRPFSSSATSGEPSSTAEGKGNEEAYYLFVDVGGGIGTDVLAFRQQFPDALGTVELQDLPAVIDSAVKVLGHSSSISLRAHDFFTKQLVQAPRFFFMGSVLHDWPDADAHKILQHIAAAMKPGYTTLLLDENVIVESTSSEEGGCHPHLTAIDLTMMTSLAGQERSESDWRELLAYSRLKIMEIHSIPSCLKSVLECELFD